MKTLHLSKFSITVITIALFSIGAISGMLITYHYFTTIHTISKEHAITIAMHYDGWTQEKFGNATIGAELLQTKLSNRVALVINDTTMSPDPYPRIVPLPSLIFQENQLVWDVTIKKHLRGMEYQEWRYVIDAINGTLIGSWSPQGYTHRNF